MPPSRLLGAATALAFPLLAPAAPEEPGSGTGKGGATPPGDAPGAAATAEKDWLEFYYENPTPERFVDQLREYSRDGTLVNENARPALVAFLSQVLRQNRDRIRDWHDTLRGLAPEEMQVLNTALLYARVSEADELLESQLGAEELAKARADAPKILEMKLAQAHTLDMLWGFFYATGSEEAVRRVVSCFLFADAPSQPDFAKIPEGFQPLYTELPEAAAWSLLSNASRHPRVREILKKLERETGKEALAPTELRLLREKVLAELPDGESPEAEPAGAPSSGKTGPAGGR